MKIVSRKPKPTWPFPTGKPTPTEVEQQKLADEEDEVVNQDAFTDEEVLRRTTKGVVDHNWIETGYD